MNFGQVYSDNKYTGKSNNIINAHIASEISNRSEIQFNSFNKIEHIFQIILIDDQESIETRSIYRRNIFFISITIKGQSHFGYLCFPSTRIYMINKHLY